MNMHQGSALDQDVKTGPNPGRGTGEDGEGTCTLVQHALAGLGLRYAGAHGPSAREGPAEQFGNPETTGWELWGAIRLITNERTDEMQVVGAGGSMKRLVVVADNSLIVEAIAIGLRKSGEFKLLGHVNGRAGSVRAILEAGPDVVLIDDMDGSERAAQLVEQIKAEQDHVAVIVLTTSMDSEWLDAIFDAGAAGAISKATHPAALATLVRETIDGHVVHVYKSSAGARSARPTAVATEQSPLTSRELEVLQLVAAGSTNGEIAQKLWVTEQTVKFHLSNVYRKLEVGNRTEASHYAHVNGLLGSAQPAGVF
jgi:DNA-binding NarL/FixJ family response regulator